MVVLFAGVNGSLSIDYHVICCLYGFSAMSLTFKAVLTFLGHLELYSGKAFLSKEEQSTTNDGDMRQLRASSYGGEPARLLGWSSLPRFHIIPNSNTKFDCCSGGLAC